MGQNRIEQVQALNRRQSPRRKSSWKRLEGFLKKRAVVIGFAIGVASAGINLSVALLNRYHPIPSKPATAEITIVVVLPTNCQEMSVKVESVIIVRK